MINLNKLFKSPKVHKTIKETLSKFEMNILFSKPLQTFRTLNESFSSILGETTI